MPRWQRAYLIACAAATAGAIAMCAGDFGRWPRPWYLPYERAWRWGAAPPPGVAMGYFGAIAWALGGAAVGALAAVAATRLRRAPLPDATLRLVGAWTGTAAVLGALYFGWTIGPLG